MGGNNSTNSALDMVGNDSKRFKKKKEHKKVTPLSFKSHPQSERSTKTGMSVSEDDSITSTANEPEQNAQIRTDNHSISNAPSSPDNDQKLQNDFMEITNISIEPQKTDSHSISNAPNSPDNDQKIQNGVTEVTNISIGPQNQPTPDVLDGDQSSCITQRLSDCNERSESTNSKDVNDSVTGIANLSAEGNINAEHCQEKTDTIEDMNKKQKKKKKKKGAAEKLMNKTRPKSNDLLIVSQKKEESIENEAKDNIRVVSPVQHTSTVDANNVGNEGEEKPSSSGSDIFLGNSSNTDETKQATSNVNEENIKTKQDRPSSADLFLAPSVVLKKKNEDDKIRQEQELNIQDVMTEEAQRLDTYCNSPNFKHSNFTHDNSLCPPAFLQSMSNIKDYLDDLRKQIKDMQLEKNDYLNRLSSVAGSMLTENNPNITDLNDPNRATKLAEKWCKIYDDEWTDALESFEKKYYKKKHEKHEQFVYHLFSLIKVIYETCRKKAKEQVGVFLLLKHPSSTQVKEMWSQIPSTERQNFTDSRKRMAEANISMLQKIIINDDVYKKKLRDLNPVLDKEILGIVENSSYFEKCLEICWRFVIQDPPLFLDIRSLAGETINKDTHKEYTKSGAVIKYVVWPALYLHCINNEKGALLAKGVVQPES